MVRAYVGLGSNSGNSIETLHKALRLLDESAESRITAQSSMYRTSPIGFLEQPDFFNMVVEINTTLSPEELLLKVLSIEKTLHRTRGIRWGPRTIDMDILLYGDKIIEQPHLRIPHPRMMERAFVLVPLYEIAGDLCIPGAVAASIRRLMDKYSPEQRIEKCNAYDVAESHAKV